MARILVVDDDQDILKLAKKVLEMEGHHVFTAVDALNAMDVLTQYSLDLMISDANMPQYTGFELISTVRKQEKHKNLSIIMLTGLRERKDVEKAIKAGADDYIVKPIDPLLFLQKVHAQFDKRPPEKHPEIRLNEKSSLRTTHVALKTDLDSVSELGVVIFSNQPLQVGSALDLKGPFFDSLHTEIPPMKVLSCEPHGQLFRVQLIFLGAKEALLQKIRAWILQHGTRQAG